MQEEPVVRKPKKTWVSVIGADRRPLMPCTPKRARLLLERGRAKVIRTIPFVIQLLDRTQDECVLQPMVVKLDPGSKVTGICVARETAPGALVVARLIELEHRGEFIKSNLAKRRMYRRARRWRNTRYRQARFLNRTKPEGWLAPSLMHRVDSTMSWVRRLMRWYPIASLAVERVKFDMQKLQDPKIAGKGYQQGTLMGYEIKEYLLEKWGRRCAYCDSNKMLRYEVDHVIPRSRGGSDRISNLVLSCHGCNQEKGNLSIDEHLAHDPKRLEKIKRQLKVPLKDAAAVNATRNHLFTELLKTGLPVATGTGAQTKMNRIRLGIPKTHALDAACVGDVVSISAEDRPTLHVSCMGRGRYRRTTPDKHGFPKSYAPRIKKAFGFQTGDIARIHNRRENKKEVGRVAIRQSGDFNIACASKLVRLSYRYCLKVQSADGYEYSVAKQ